MNQLALRHALAHLISPTLSRKLLREACHVRDIQLVRRILVQGSTMVVAAPSLVYFFSS